MTKIWSLSTNSAQTNKVHDLPPGDKLQTYPQKVFGSIKMEHVYRSSP